METSASAPLHDELYCVCAVAHRDRQHVVHPLERVAVLLLAGGRAGRALRHRVAERQQRVDLRRADRGSEQPLMRRRRRERDRHRRPRARAAASRFNPPATGGGLGPSGGAPATRRCIPTLPHCPLCSLMGSHWPLACSLISYHSHRPPPPCCLASAMIQGWRRSSSHYSHMRSSWRHRLLEHRPETRQVP